MMSVLLVSTVRALEIIYHKMNQHNLRFNILMLVLSPSFYTVNANKIIHTFARHNFFLIFFSTKWWTQCWNGSIKSISIFFGCNYNNNNNIMKNAVMEREGFMEFMVSSEYVWHIFKTTTIIISIKRGGFLLRY